MLNVSSDIGSVLKMKWVINSPRLREACENLLINPRELKRKTIEQCGNENPGASEAHLSAIYNIHLRTLRLHLNQVIEERKRIIKEGSSIPPILNL